MPRHSEETNIQIRRTVRRSPPKPTDIQPAFYTGDRFTDLDSLETVRGTARSGLPYVATPGDRLPLQALTRAYTDSLMVYQVANDFVFAQTPSRTGLFTLEEIAFRWEGNILQDMRWGLAIGSELPTTISQWIQLKRITPTSAVYDQNTLLLLHPPDIYVQGIKHTVSLNNQSLIWAIFTDGAQGGDNYAQLQTVLSEA